MTTPNISVQMALLSNASLGTAFILDSGPVTTGRGALNNSSYTLGGVVFVDVTQWCSGQITTNRGRSRETEQYQAGTASFTLRNEDRRFDPTNTASPYYPYVQPRALVNIYLEGLQIFGGFVDDLVVNYEKPNICTVDVTCVDAFNVLANTFLSAWSASNGVTTGARVTAVLTQVNFPATRSVATGVTVLQGGTITSSALDHLQTCARSENGYLFCARDGTLVFLDRYSFSASGVPYLQPASLSTPGALSVSNVAGAVSLSSVIPISFADDGTGIPYQAIGQKSQALLLYNTVTGTKTGSTAQTASDATSITTYLTRTLSLGTLENSTDADVLNLCQYLVGRYKNPDVRFDSITVELSSLTLANREAMAGLELVNLVSVTRDPPGGGTPSVITKTSIIDGLKFMFDVSASIYKLTVQLGSVDSRNFFILDSQTLGILDTSLLNY